MTDINRHHSRPLDVHRWSDNPEAKELRDTVWNQYFKEVFPPAGGKGNKAKSEPKKQFKVLLLDLYVAWLDDPELSIGVGMSNSAYKKNARYNALHISAKIIQVAVGQYSMKRAEIFAQFEKDILAGKEAPLARKAIYLPNGKKIEQHYRMLEKQQIYMFNPKI